MRTAETGELEKQAPPWDLLQPGRPIQGISAVLLPWLDEYQIDWESWERHLLRTVDLGLIPAVNMDTGYVQLLTDRERLEVLDRARSLVAGGVFVAGATVRDEVGARYNREGYFARLEEIASRGGTPVVFPSYGLGGLPMPEVVRAYEEMGARVDRFIGFELSDAFVPFGRLLDLQAYEAMMAIQSCIGAKHSSLSRGLEWDRLRLRNRVRPDFRVFTGNDWAIDMVMFGSDYLLGLSTMAPDLFVRRDKCWQQNDPAFFEWNDRLQALGSFTFRHPVPAYKHSAAQFLHLRGWTKTNLTHRASPQRPDSDGEVLRQLAERLGVL